ncbi:MAG TPA: flagellar basal body P-ring formation chaperone FlgA [Planctomycetota bacterium]|nr:flagellar basal body P-ring formation chaperone FlgA [Planctomycetota bacterium]
MILTLAILSFGGVTVTLSPEARVRGSVVALGQLALVEGDDAAEVERIAAAQLGYAPAPGYSRLFTAERLRQELGLAAPGVALTLAGSSACRVWPEVERLEGEAIDAAAEAELRRHLGARDASAQLVARSASIEVPAGREAARLRSVLSGSALQGGLLTVPVRVLVDGEPYRTVWTTWKVELWEELDVLTRPVRAGDTITREMLVRRRVPAPAAGGPAAPRPLGAEMLAGSRAVRDLAAGQPLVELDVVRPSIVQRGDALSLEIRKGAVCARLGAVAEQAGALGDRVRVSFPGSERTLAGVVAGRGLVRIDLGGLNP